MALGLLLPCLSLSKATITTFSPDAACDLSNPVCEMSDSASETALWETSWRRFPSGSLSHPSHFGLARGARNSFCRW